jgi:hypothetical protein
LWYSAIGCLGTVLIGILVSYATNFQDPAELDPDLISPPLRRFFSWTKTKSSTSHALGIINFALEIDDEKSKIETNGNVDKPK